MDGCWSLGTAQMHSDIFPSALVPKRMFSSVRKFTRTLLKKKNHKRQNVCESSCTKLGVRWSCSVMETNPSECEVMCVESIQQYCGLCSIQIQQVIWEVAHSFRLQECEPAIHKYHTELESSTHTHTHANTSIFNACCLKLFFLCNL